MTVHAVPVRDRDWDRRSGVVVASAVPERAFADSRTSQALDAEQDDHFVTDEFGNKFAGRHLIIDLQDVHGPLLADLALIRRTLVEAAEISGATVLNVDLHRFEPNGGISGVAVLSESHISIHTWPERGYAAIDAFMCGDARPERAVKVLRRAFQPGNVQVTELKRGMVTSTDD